MRRPYKSMCLLVAIFPKEKGIEMPILVFADQRFDDFGHELLLDRQASPIGSAPPHQRTV
jgi:hypothetical protein